MTFEVRPTADLRYSRRAAAFPAPSVPPWGDSEAPWILCSGRGAAWPITHGQTSGNLRRLLLYLERIVSKSPLSLPCDTLRSGPKALEGRPATPAPVTRSFCCPGDPAGVCTPVTPAAPCCLSLCLGPPSQGLPLPPTRSSRFHQSSLSGPPTGSSCECASVTERGARLAGYP